MEFFVIELQIVLFILECYADVQPVLKRPLFWQIVVEEDVSALLSLDEFGLLILSCLIYQLFVKLINEKALGLLLDVNILLVLGFKSSAQSSKNMILV